MGRRLPKLPDLLNRKIYKTGQTRGADMDEIYQNRVSRNCTAVIRYENYVSSEELRSKQYENGYVVVVKPEVYFNSKPEEFQDLNLVLGSNMLLFYQRREQWNTWNPEKMGLEIAKSRTPPLGGQYVARVAGTTSSDQEGGTIRHGYNSTGLRGLGIREYEYASTRMINLCRVQLSALYWHAEDALEEAIRNGMSESNAKLHRDITFNSCGESDLDNYEQLVESRFINKMSRLVCPLCLEPIHASEFYSRVVQVEGRETHDQTVTEVSLFHLEELRPGQFNHRIYNLGWGHHHCNVVVKDSGIEKTINWMRKVVENNQNHLL